MKSLLLALTASLEIIHVSAIPSAARSSQICGKPGYDAGTESFWGSNVASYAACAKECSKRKQCQSFAYGSGECQLYQCSVKSNFVPVADSPYLFYDSSCITASASTTTTTSTIAKTTTSTTEITSSTTKTIIITSSTKAATTMSRSPAPTTKTTSKATTTTTTAPAASTSASNGLICGQSGYVQGSSGFHGYYESYNTTQDGLNACYNYCVTSTESYCTFWQYSPGECVLYSYDPAGRFIAESNGVYYWQQGCGQPVDTIDS